jgi:hypothetical protein
MAGGGNRSQAGRTTPSPTSPASNPAQAAQAVPVEQTAPTPAANEPAANEPAAAVAPPTAQADGERPESAVARGTPVSVASLEVTVLSARFAQRAGRNQFLRHTAPEGARLLLVNYRVRNTTNEPITVLSFADSVLSGGATYNASSSCEMALNALGASTPINPNIPRTFDACFEVPTEGSGFVVKFNRAMTDRYVQTGL